METIDVPGRVPDAPRRRVSPFARVNGPVFYAAGAACLLTAQTCAGAEKTAAAFAGYERFRDWLLGELMPRRTARVHRLREYFAVTWPDFDWASASDGFTRLIGTPGRFFGQSPTQRALIECASAAQSAVFFRGLRGWAEDSHLRALADASASEESEAFVHWRELYEALSERSRMGVYTSWSAVRESMRAARDRHVQTAFTALVEAWGPNAPFPALTYAEFVRRVVAAIRANAGLTWAERVVFGPWAAAPMAAPARTKAAEPHGFKPVIAVWSPEAEDRLSP